MNDARFLTLTNLLWLSAAIALVVAPHLARLPLWLSAFCVIVFLARLYLAVQGGRLPRNWLLLIVTTVATVGVVSHYKTILGRDAGVAMLIVLLVLKLLELKAQRDAVIVIFLGYFLVIANFLYSQTVLMGAYMLVVVWVFTAALVGFNYTNTVASLRDRLGPAGSILMQAVPLMFVVFLLFPRIDGPLWRLPKDAHSGLSGLSDSMTPGSIASLSLSGAIAFRVKFDGPMPKPAELYWRGPVLAGFDGRTWRVQSRSARQPPRLEAIDRTTRYTVTLEPHNKPWLFALDLPRELPAQSSMTSEYQLLSPSPVTARRRYAMTSALGYRAQLDASERELSAYRTLPTSGNPQARALAGSWRQSAANAREIINFAQQHFRSEAFYYTLSPPLLQANAVDDFLFNTRSGFCEHYAGSFAFLMRAAGIPARVVTGYQGGEVNPMADYLIVRQADAHAWVEVWLEGAGWVRVDPTALVAPTRVEQGIEAAIPSIGIDALMLRDEFGWLDRIRLSWDAFNNAWNQWVLGYDQERQRFLFTRLGMPRVDWKSLTYALAIAAIAIGVILMALLLSRYRAGKQDRVLKSYELFCRKLARLAIVRAPQEGPLDFAARAAALEPELAADIDRVTWAYVNLRYAKSSNEISDEAFRRLVREFRPA